MATTKAKEKASKQDQSFEEGDDSLTINMDEVEGQSFENIPKGTYNCVIEKCEFQLSKSSNKPMWNVMLSIVDGEYANRKLFTNISFSEGALPMSKATIQAIAPELLSSAFNPKKIADEGDLLGKTCRAKTKIEAYNGEDRTRVDRLMAPGGSGDGFLDNA